jgi:hypothetical protein
VNQTIYNSYASLAELVEYAHGKSEMQDDQRASREGCGKLPNDRPTWHGATWDQASQMSRNGDIDGARKLQAKVLEATNALIHDKPRLDPEYRLDEGHWIDVSKYVKGEPECWGAMIESDTMLPRRGIALIVNVSFSAGVSAKSIEEVGAHLGGTILALQSLGYAVTLYACETISGGNNYVISAPVNPSASALDMSKVSIIIRPWFLRRIMFSLEETYDKKTREDIGVGWGYGHPRNITMADAKTIGGSNVTPVIVNMQDFIDRAHRVRDHIIFEVKKGSK